MSAGGEKLLDEENLPASMFTSDSVALVTDLALITDLTNSEF